MNDRLAWNPLRIATADTAATWNIAVGAKKSFLTIQKIRSFCVTFTHIFRLSMLNPRRNHDRMDRKRRTSRDRNKWRRRIALDTFGGLRTHLSTPRRPSDMATGTDICLVTRRLGWQITRAVLDAVEECRTSESSALTKPAFGASVSGSEARNRNRRNDKSI